LLTQGTRASASRARSRSIEKNVPVSSLRITDSRCAPLVRASGVVTTTSRNSNAESRVTKPTTAQVRNAIAINDSVTAIAFSCFASSHMRASQDFDAKIGERRARLFRRHRHEAVAGHPRRRVHLEERVRAVGAQDQVEPAPAAAADDVERGERTCADLVFLRRRKTARAEVFRLVGEI